MDPIEVPEDLSELDVEGLESLATELADRASSFADIDPDELNDSQLDEVEAIADLTEAVTAELSARRTALAARRSRATNAAARLSSATVELADATVVEEPEVEDPEEDQAFSVEDELGDVDGPADPAPAPDGAVVASGRVVGRKLTEGLTARRPAAARPKARSEALMVASSHLADVPGFREGQAFASPAEVAAAITQKRLRMGDAPEGTRQKLILASGRKELAFAVGHDAGQNLAMFGRMQAEHTKIVESGFSQDALVASGGCCAPFTPLYEFFRTAVPATPIEDSLPTAEAPRGGIRFIPGTDWRDAAAGVGVYTCADGLEDDPVVEKPVVHVVCPDVEDAETYAVTQAVSFDNLQYRVFPELVESFQADLAVAFANRKEVGYMTAIDSASTAVTATGTLGAVRTTFEALTRGAVQYRARHAMDPQATLPVYLEAWVRDALAQDALFDASHGVESLSAAYRYVDDGFRVRNLQPIYWRNLANGAGTIALAQGAGALNAWPTTIVARYHAPGTFTRLDGASLDVGLYRDSALNRTNDLEMFMEEWLGIAFTGAEGVKLTITTSVTGVAPVTTLLDCDCDGS